RRQLGSGSIRMRRTRLGKRKKCPRHNPNLPHQSTAERFSSTNDSTEVLCILPVAKLLATHFLFSLDIFFGQVFTIAIRLNPSAFSHRPRLRRANALSPRQIRKWSPAVKLLDQVRQQCRVRHYSIRTEKIKGVRARCLV